MQKYKYKIQEKNNTKYINTQCTKYIVHSHHRKCPMYNAEIQYSAQNTKYEKQNTQCKKYLVQSHHRECLKYKALIQYSTMCKSTREKKSQALATPPLLSLVNYPQFSIHLYSFCILGTLHICTQYLYFQSICVLSVFYNLCLHCCSSIL